MSQIQKITPFLWFNDNAEEAVNFYVSVFKNAQITSANKGSDGKLFTGSIEIEGTPFMVLNGGPMHAHFTESISLFVSCKDQEEVDLLWEKLISDGGEESRCGWLKDKFGLSWQIIPEALNECLGGSDQQGSQRAMQAMMQMKKIIVADLKSAYEGK